MNHDDIIELARKFKAIRDELQSRGVSPDASEADLQRRATEKADADAKAKAQADEDAAQALARKFTYGKYASNAEQLVEDEGVEQAEKLKAYLEKELIRERRVTQFNNDRDIARIEKQIADIESSLIKRRNR